MNRPSPEEIVAAVTVLARLVACEQLAAAQSSDGEWIDHSDLPLSPRRLLPLLRTRLASGKGGVVRNGRAWRVRRDVVPEILEATGKLSRKVRTASPDVLERIEQKLRLVGGI